jgi:acyl carrier protein
MTSAPPPARTAAEIRLDESLAGLGLDSMQFVVLVGELEDWLGCRFTSNPLVAHPSINALSQFLARQISAGRTRIDPTSD